MNSTPSVLGPYEVLEAVGKGGMGTVYRGRRTDTGQTVAIKVMEARAASHPVLVKRFEQEFIAAGRLRHPNIVRGLDFGMHEGRPYLVMEFVEGRDLTRRIAEAGPLAPDRAVPVILQVAAALQFAHQNNLIHRDVKSDNVLLTKDGEAKLTDLGLSKDLDGCGGLTQTRTCLGTIAFIAPEQYEDAKRADARSDVYGLGATLYHALTGRPPFQGRRNLEVLRKKLQNDFVPACRLVPGLPRRIDEVIRKALDAQPSGRHRSCQEFIDALTEGRAVPRARGSGRAAEGADDAEPDSDPSDRRRAIRYPSSLGASCRPLHDGRKRWDAEVQDISVTGVRLRVGRRFEPGAVLAVEVLDGRSDSSSTLYVKVLWVREAAPKQWEIGCVFNSALGPSELDTYLDKPRTVVMCRE